MTTVAPADTSAEDGATLPGFLRHPMTDAPVPPSDNTPDDAPAAVQTRVPDQDVPAPTIDSAPEAAPEDSTTGRPCCCRSQAACDRSAASDGRRRLPRQTLCAFCCIAVPRSARGFGPRYRAFAEPFGRTARFHSGRCGPRHKSLSRACDLRQFPLARTVLSGMKRLMSGYGAAW